MSITIAFRPEVLRAMGTLQDARDRTATPAADRLLTRALDTLATDPTLALTPTGQRALDLLAELVRQLRPVTRQADLSREHARLTSDDTLTGTDRARQINKLGKLNPNALAAETSLLTRLDEETRALADLANPDWQSSEHLDRVAVALLPSERVLTEIADQLRARVAAAAAVAPRAPQVRALIDLADQIDPAVESPGPWHLTYRVLAPNSPDGSWPGHPRT